MDKITYIELVNVNNFAGLKLLFYTFFLVHLAKAGHLQLEHVLIIIC